MRSQLARSARRAHPRLLTRCALLPPHSTFLHHHRGSPPGARLIPASHNGSCPGSRRTFLGVFKKPPRKVHPVQIDPGYETFLMFTGNKSEGSRPPPRGELIQAFNQFFRYKLQHRKCPNATQARMASDVFKYLMERWPAAFQAPELQMAQEALLLRTKGDTTYHLELFREIHKAFVKLKSLHSSQAQARPGEDAKRNQWGTYLAEEAEKMDSRMQQPGPFMPATLDGAPEQDSSSGPEAHWTDLHRYVSGLAQFGQVDEAIAELEKFSANRRVLSPQDVSVWMNVLRGAAKHCEEEVVLSTLNRIEELGIPYGPALQEIMVAYYADRGDAGSLWRWFDRSANVPTAKTYHTLLSFAKKYPDAVARVMSVFRNLCASDPKRDLWDVILVWTLTYLGQGLTKVKEVVKTLSEEGDNYPNIATINCLVRAARDLKDPLLAERILEWRRKLGIESDETTYALQVDYRLEARDYSGASGSFSKLMDFCENEEFAGGDEIAEMVEDTANKYLKALCAPEHMQRGGTFGHGGRLLPALTLVEENRISLEPETTSALCVAFLENDQTYELIDTLSLHTMHFSVEERQVVWQAMVDYCLNPANSTSRVWDAYSLLRQLFPDTLVEAREKIFDMFMTQRRRPDMAVSVFGHMRAHSQIHMRPSADLYAKAFASLGMVPSAGQDTHIAPLKQLHNMLKMDVRIQPDTKMYTALMIAYTGCGEPDTAMEFWREISVSPAGPTYNSLAVYFWTCEKMPYGDKKAKEIYAKLKRMDVAVPPFVFGAYCGAIAGNGNVDALKEVLQGMEGSGVGYTPNTSMLRIAYNAIPWPDARDEFGEWCAKEYPAHWSELTSKVPRIPAPDGGKMFKHPRDDIKP